MVKCENKRCEYWHNEYSSKIDNSIHCRIYEGEEMLSGFCSSFIGAVQPQNTLDTCQNSNADGK